MTRPLLAALLLCVGIAHAGTLEFDPTAPARTNRFMETESFMLDCMYATAGNKLNMGERDEFRIVREVADTCGGPMTVYLVDENHADKYEARTYIIRMSRAVLRSIPGVRRK